MNDIFNELSKKLNLELKETDFTSIYEDIDLLSGISEYDKYLSILDNNSLNKEERKKIQKEFEKIEKKSLNKHKLIKLKGEDKNFYCLKDSVYDNVGMLIEDNFNDYFDEEDIFCEYNGDNIYNYMRKILLKKITTYNEKEEE